MSDAECEAAVRAFLAKQLDDGAKYQDPQSPPLQTLLRDGIDLCRLVNKVLKVPVRYHNPASHPYKAMDNVSKFIASCAVLGVQSSFEVADLHQNKNFSKVLATLRQLIRLMSPATPVPPSPRPPPRFVASSSASSSTTTTSSAQPSVKAPAAPAVAGEWEPVRAWLAKVLNDGELAKGPDALLPRLKTGVPLCRLANMLRPGSVPAAIYTGRVSFLQAQNIELYVRACANAGLPGAFLFDPGDLQFERNIPKVMANVVEVARRIAANPAFRGPPAPVSATQKQQQQQQQQQTPAPAPPVIDPSQPGGRDFERDAAKPPDTPEETALLEWANALLLQSAGEQPLRNLGGDARTGVKLIKLACALTKGRPIAPWSEKPTTLLECDRNAAVLFEFLQQQLLAPIPEATCVPRDVTYGRALRIASLLALMRDRFDADYHFQEILSAAAAASPSETDDLSEYGSPPSGTASAPSSRPASPLVLASPLAAKRAVVVASTPPSTAVAVKRTVVVSSPPLPPPAAAQTVEAVQVSASIAPPKTAEQPIGIPVPPVPPPAVTSAEDEKPMPTAPAQPIDITPPPLPSAMEEQARSPTRGPKLQLPLPPPPPPPQLPDEPERSPRIPTTTAPALPPQIHIMGSHKKAASIDMSGFTRPAKPLPPPPPPPPQKPQQQQSDAAPEPDAPELPEPAPLQATRSLPSIEPPLPPPKPQTAVATIEPPLQTAAESEKRLTSPLSPPAALSQMSSPEQLVAPPPSPASTIPTVAMPEEETMVEGEGCSQPSKGHSKSSSGSSEQLVTGAVGASTAAAEDIPGTPKLWHFAMPGTPVTTTSPPMPGVWESAPATSSPSGSIAATASPRLGRSSPAAASAERSGHRRRPSAPPATLGQLKGFRQHSSSSAAQLPSAVTLSVMSVATSKMPLTGAGGDLEAGHNTSQLSLHRDRSGSAAPPPTFGEMMASPVLRRQFQDFLEERHASENMQFLSETANFARHEMPHSEMMEEAQRIYNKFCRPDAPSEVNLSGANRAFLQQLFRSGDPTQITSKMFSRAHSEMANMLQSSLFAEWTRQPIDWASARAASAASFKKPKSRQRSGLLATLRLKQDVGKAQNLIRLRTVTELLRSEERYVQALGTCKQHLAKPGASRSLDGGNLSQDEIGGVFSSFAYLHFHHKRLCDALRERVALWSEASTVGDLFLEHSRIFEDYYSYCQQYSSALARLHTVITLRRPLRESRMLRLGDLEQAEKLDATLEQYVMLPTQRLPQYLFSQMQLLRYTPKTHGDYGLLHQAEAETRKAVERVMEIIDSGAAPHTHKLLAIASSIDGRQAELLVVPRRRFVREGSLSSVAFTWRASSRKPATTTTVRKPYAFLFEDLLVVCETGSHNADKPYTFVAQLEVPDIRAIHVNHALVIEISLHLGIMRSAAPAFGVTAGSPVSMMTCVLRAHKEEERFMWEADISRLLSASTTRFRRGLSTASSTERPFLARSQQQQQQSAAGTEGISGSVAATMPARRPGRPSHAPTPLPPVPRPRRASAADVPETPLQATATETTAPQATTTTTTTAATAAEYEFEGSASAADGAAAAATHERKPSSSYESCDGPIAL